MSHLYTSELARCPLNADPFRTAAVPAGKYKGRKVYRVPVYVRCNDTQACATVASYWLTVKAYSAAEAANWVAANIDRPNTEIIAIGPKRGQTHRFVGWHTVIGRSIIGRDIQADRQLKLC